MKPMNLFPRFCRMICLVILLISAQNLMFAQNSWKLFGNLNYARHLHNALPISGSKVLVMGGYINSSGPLSGTVTASCEIIDISTKQIYSTSAMISPRTEFVSLMTKDSNIVVVSGYGTPTVEIFERAIGKWRNLGNLLIPRRQHSAIFINDTEILVIGGRNINNLNAMSTAEIFNIHTGVSRPVSDYPLVVATLAIGKTSLGDIIACAGRDGGTNSARKPDIYKFDLANEQWQYIGQLPQANAAPQILKLWDSRLMMSGGSIQESPMMLLPTVVMENKNQFSIFSKMHSERLWHGMAQWNQDSIIILGGYNNDNVNVKGTDWINLQNGSSGIGPNLIIPRRYLQAVTLINPPFEGLPQTSVILAICGLDANNTNTSTVEILFRDISNPVFSTNPSSTSGTVSCYNVSGTVSDSGTFDTGIQSLTVMTSATVNTYVSISPILSPASSVNFSASLKNYRQDGWSTLVAVDSSGNSSTEYIDIPGFTVKLDTIILSNDVAFRSDTVKSNTSGACFAFSIKNYGKFPQEIDSLVLSQKKSHYSISPNVVLPFILPAGQSKKVEICYFGGSKGGIFEDTLFAVNSCGRSTMANLELVVDPQVVISKSCFKVDGTIYFVSNTTQNFSITGVSNATLNILPKQSPDSVNFTVSLIDTRNDGAFTLGIVQSSGATVFTQYKIPGFTVKIDTILNSQLMTSRYDSVEGHSGTYCFKYTLINYGGFPHQINSAPIVVTFSPYTVSNSTTFPFNLMPGEKKEIEVCFVTNMGGHFIDTLNLADNCGKYPMSALELKVHNLISGCDSIAGIVNLYAAVQSLSDDRFSVTLENNVGFIAGSSVVVLQMQGASIDTTNSANYGSITSMNGAGNYEFAVIESVVGNIVRFTKPLIHSDYFAGGRIQLISVAEYDHVTVYDTLKAQPWNGKTGGVIAISANCLMLAAPIDATGVGFRGGNYLNQIGCSGTGGNFDYVSKDSCLFSWKGEGIAGTGVNGKFYGRGAPANGGGGGNNSNGGGGGGGNFGAGGIGGFGYAGISGQSQTRGIGGESLSANFDWKLGKVFLGAGGGAGHTNNQHGTGGANGGGIILIRAGIVNPNLNILRANGETAQNDTNYTNPDGCGGGGAAGTIILDIKNNDGYLNLSAIGGNGGSRTKSSLMTSGPGGGGGGGFVAFGDKYIGTAPIESNIWGGKAGFDPEGTQYGATDGLAGQYAMNYHFLSGTKLPELGKCYGCYPVIDTMKSDCGEFDFTIIDAGYQVQSIEFVTTGTVNVTWASNKIPSYAVNLVLTLKDDTKNGRFLIKATNTNGKTLEYSGIILPKLTPPVVSQKGDTLICNVADAVKYQWYWNGQPLGMGMWRIYRLGDAGSYTVEITDKNGCKAISAPFIVDLSDVPETKIANGNLRIYPNPANETLNISGQIGTEEQKVRIELLNLLGERIMNYEILGGSLNFTMNMYDLPIGMYVVRLQSGTDLWMKKIVKK